MIENAKLDGLFPTPILTIKRPTPYLQEEYDYVKSVNVSFSNENGVSPATDIINAPQLSNLKSFFIDAINLFTDKIYCASSDELDISISWINVVNPGKQHLPHVHKNAIISGVYYFENTEDCPLYFVNPLVKYNVYDFSKRYDHNHFNSEEYSWPSSGNELIMFPAWLEHGVRKNNTNITRYSLAFNAWFKPNKTYGFATEKTLIKT